MSFLRTLGRFLVTLSQFGDLGKAYLPVVLQHQHFALRLGRLRQGPLPPIHILSQNQVEKLHQRKLPAPLYEVLQHGGETGQHLYRP